MSRRDITYILQKLSLDHRTSLAEKACAFLQAAESNRAIKSHSSHAAICVDIAAKALDIEVSREALVLISGAANLTAYNSTRQTLSRVLIGESTKDSEDDATISKNVSFHHMRVLLKKVSLGYLRQLIIREGSMELEDLVLDCLKRFFEKWEPSLSPAQRIHINHSDAKWVAASFWLCAMARSMTVAKDEEIDSGKGKAPKKIGGRKGKELKENILDTVEHKVTKVELEKTIRLIEQETSAYLLSLRASKGKARGSGTTTPTSAPSTPRKRKPSNENSSFVEIDIPVRGGGQVQPAKIPQWREPDAKEGEDESSTARKRPNPDVYRTLSTKRQMSNVSLVSDEGDQASSSSSKYELSTRPTRPPPAKRTKVETPAQLSSADIMRPKKSTGQKSLKETTIPDPVVQRRKTGVYSMIPRVGYQKTKAYQQYQEWRKNILRTIVKE
ncbi:MAG: hypothetical protein BYD32DRAFT_488381 [Podila humilis]|nr:MAG: hypothetical protein BYD32DRAFT_488381 [Podila humilis]